VEEGAAYALGSRLQVASVRPCPRAAHARSGASSSCGCTTPTWGAQARKPGRRACATQT
jgi:hypothetical protein